MDTKGRTRRMLGGHAVVEALRAHGVRHLFNVPGESFTAVLDGLREAPEIQLVTNRQEGGACFMAEAYAKTTRQVGVCIVTRGPGATNASIGIHCARYDATPLVLLVGQVPRAARGRELGQELDYRHFFGHMTKWVTEINDPRRVPQIMARAFHVARSGRPGPVVVSLPRDMLDEEAELTRVDPYPLARPHPDPAQMRELVSAINKARTPLLMVGAQVQWDGAREELIAFAEKFHLPVITTGRRLDCFPNDHPLYVGNIGTARNHTQQLLADTDLLVAVGTRLKQRSTANFTLPAVGTPFIQIFPDEEVIGQNQRPAMGIVADTRLALAAALKQRAAKTRPERKAWVGEYRAVQVKYSTPPTRPSRKVSMESVMTDMRALLPRNTIYTMDSGNNSQWLQRYIEFNEPDSFLAPTVGSMGYGVPSAVAAKLAHPERTVISNCGDGGFLMTGQEMASAAQAGAKIITVVYNNNAYATIRMHQEMAFPGRPKGTDMSGADFSLLGQGYGALGLKVTRDEQFRPALAQALAADRSALIEVMTDLEQLSPSANLSEVTRGKPGR